MPTEMPTRRFNVLGTDLDGRRLELALSVSKQLYVCPSCGGHLQIGDEHVVVRVLGSGAGTYHQHWHSRCVRSALLREMHGAKRVPAKWGR